MPPSAWWHLCRRLQLEIFTEIMELSALTVSNYLPPQPGPGPGPDARAGARALARACEWMCRWDKHGDDGMIDRQRLFGFLIVSSFGRGKGSGGAVLSRIYLQDGLATDSILRSTQYFSDRIAFLLPYFASLRGASSRFVTRPHPTPSGVSTRIDHHISCTWTAVLAHMAMRGDMDNGSRAEPRLVQVVTPRPCIFMPVPIPTTCHRTDGGEYFRHGAGGGSDGELFDMHCRYPSVAAGNLRRYVVFWRRRSGCSVRILGQLVGLQYRGARVETWPKQERGRRGGRFGRK